VNSFGVSFLIPRRPFQVRHNTTLRKPFGLGQPTPRLGRKGVKKQQGKSSSRNQSCLSTQSVRVLWV